MRDGKNQEGACVKCGTCNTVCPVYAVTGNEIHSPRGKQHLKSRIAAHEASPHYADIFSKCLLCGACQDACPRGLDTPGLVIRTRAELPILSGLTFLKYVTSRALVHPSLLAGMTRIGSAASRLLGGWLPQESGLRLRLQGLALEALQPAPAGYLEKIRAEMAAEGHEGRPKAEMLFFTGCFANHLQPEIAEATQMLLLKSTGRKALVPLQQTCCGMAALAAGRIEEARDLARKNISAFETGDWPILTSCSSCYYQLKSYPELLGDEPQWRERAQNFTERLREFSTFFLERFGGAAAVPAATADAGFERVLYHDPCHLRYKLHITNEPRALIRLLPGIELQELPNGPQCCGQGGLFQVAHTDLARQIQAGLRDDYEKIAGATVVTACSGCLLQWQGGLASGIRTGKAEHLATFMVKHLR